MIVFDSIARSNLPQREKSYLARWADSMTGGRASEFLQDRRGGMNFGMSHLHTGLDTVRQYGEGITTGGILGALHAHDAMDPFGVPVDGVAGLLLGALGVMGSEHESSKDARNVGASCATIYSFRKVSAVLKKLSGDMAGEGAVSDQDPNSPMGSGTDNSEVGEDDPIVAFAKTL